MPNGAELRHRDHDRMRGESCGNLDVLDAFAEDAILQPARQRISFRLTQRIRIRRVDEIRRSLIFLEFVGTKLGDLKGPLHQKFEIILD